MSNLFNVLTADYEIEAYPTSNGYDLKWCQSLGIGYLPSRGYDYGEVYWHKYIEYINNGIGARLTSFRKGFILDNIGRPENLCDVGIGSGQFIESIGCKGFDINPFAREWLVKHAILGDPYQEPFTTLSFWDVLEHIDDPSPLLLKTKQVFMSIPINTDVHMCLKSKHLRPDEHIWHFTEDGIKTFMCFFGFTLVDQSDEEIRIGRENILSYYFTKINNHQL